TRAHLPRTRPDHRRHVHQQDAQQGQPAREVEADEPVGPRGRGEGGRRGHVGSARAVRGCTALRTGRGNLAPSLDTSPARGMIHGMISFIIPAHNEEALLGRTLSALHEAARALGEPYEVIVANDASTDRTGAIALEHGARMVAIDRRQIAATRNAGARAAAGELLVFVDADTVVTRRVVRAAVRALRGGAVGGGCSVRI